jgi:hypothetical protein
MCRGGIRRFYRIVLVSSGDYPCRAAGEAIRKHGGDCLHLPIMR